MSDGEVEVEAPQGYPVLPKDVVSEIGSTKLFNKWSYEDVEIRDISLTYVDRMQIWQWNMDRRTEAQNADE
jgi:small subunit ribosomal protein S5e